MDGTLHAGHISPEHALFVLLHHSKFLFPSSPKIFLGHGPLGKKALLNNSGFCKNRSWQKALRVNIYKIMLWNLYKNYRIDKFMIRGHSPTTWTEFCQQGQKQNFFNLIMMKKIPQKFNKTSCCIVAWPCLTFWWKLNVFFA